MRLTQKIRDKFDGVALEGFAVAGSPAALEALGGTFANISCVCCGARIGNVFLTSHGPMGGDCLATLTGDDSTRKAVRALATKLSHQDTAGEYEVEATSRGVAIRALRRIGFDEYEGRTRYGYGWCVAVVNLPLDIVRAMVADAGLRIVG